MVCRIVFWNTSLADEIPKLSRLSPTCVTKVVIYWLSGDNLSWWYPEQRSNLENICEPLRLATSSSIVGEGWHSRSIALFAAYAVGVVWFRDCNDLRDREDVFQFVFADGKSLCCVFEIIPTLFCMVLPLQTSNVFSVFRTGQPSLFFRPKSMIMLHHVLNNYIGCQFTQGLYLTILAIVYKCFTNNAPSYLRDLTIPYKCNKPGLRSSNDDRLLTIPKTRSLSGDMGFYHAGPDLWNNLPHYIRHAPSLTKFKKDLKTYFFPNWVWLY